MTSQVLEALQQVEPGQLVRDIRFRGVSVVTRGLREGELPDDSPLAKPDTRTFIATNSSPDGRAGEIALALEHIHGNQAELDLAPRIESAANNPTYLREVVSGSAEVCDVDEVLIQPESTPVSAAVLENMGFHAVNGSGMMSMHIRRAA